MHGFFFPDIILVHVFLNPPPPLPPNLMDHPLAGAVGKISDCFDWPGQGLNFG